MLFSSVTFLLLFLPLTVGIYYLCPQKLRNAFLLLASIIFYAWGEPRYLLVMFAIILINYGGALLIDKFTHHAKLFLTLTIAINIAFLIYFKYFNFIIQNINDTLKTSFSLWDIALPLGISFYVFQAISYTIDVYRKQVQVQKSLYKLSLYISLFPQLIAGPIVKYHDIAAQIDKRYPTFEEFYYGLRRFIIGLAKKVLIADILGAVADDIFSQDAQYVSTSIAWLGGITRALQVYYDFSGYSDMAIGLGHLFGFTFKENFNYPYISRTMGEYWRRWHISLGAWCKDYIYIPMGGSRVSTPRIYFNLFVLFFVIGLWHGATWNFVLFGIWNAMLIMFERATGLGKQTFSFTKSIFAYIYTIFAFIINAILGNTDTFEHSITHIKNMFGLINHVDAPFLLEHYVTQISIGTLIFAIFACMPIFKNILMWGKVKHTYIRVGVDCWLLILLIISGLQIVASTYNAFIYFRF